MVSVLALRPETPETQPCIVHPLVDPFRSLAQAEVFSFSLDFVSLDAHYNPCPVRRRYPWCTQFRLANWNFRSWTELFDRSCVWLL